eukprot:CAMPEP_0113685598 /NCGR_PEP_ID=MMETSP0038_2-20120614/14772_1 /TAXON_ID=2898 /ORGANISM="Cryptomonas paramecium" /LENGTH=90 /DNA_ID=CAMNT_0000605725 /DNA_START=300 /DNA_END=572 /DNA_ORIENTATION=- /assembly_acc=CAM_ASM_000170
MAQTSPALMGWGKPAPLWCGPVPGCFGGLVKIDSSSEAAAARKTRVSDLGALSRADVLASKEWCVEERGNGQVLDGHLGHRPTLPNRVTK